MPQVGGSELQGAEQSKLRLVPSVYSIITRHTDTMMQKEGSRVAEHVESTLLRMHFCRTADLGKRVYQCSDCQEELTIYNSCGDRHCPQCSGARRRNWLENTLKLTDCHSTYFQVVFTLPGKLSSLALGNRKEIYNLLFDTAWDSLRERIEKELGIQAAGVGVLHTWNQRLGHHPHVHFMVPGSGVSLDGTRWIPTRLEWNRQSKKRAPFFVDNKRLGQLFRTLFLSRLRQMVEQGKIKIDESGYIADLLSELSDQDWVVFVEGPPDPECTPATMLKYLTKYLTGGPISDKRIVGEEGGRIYFKARSEHKGGGQVTASLPALEFVRRWSLHILPKDFTKTRFYGAWSYTKRLQYKELYARLRPWNDEPRSDNSKESVKTGEKELEKARCCAKCGKEMSCIRQVDRPKWRDLFYGPSHPHWYEYTSKGQNSPSMAYPEQLVSEEDDQEFETYRALQALEWEVTMGLSEAEQ